MDFNVEKSFFGIKHSIDFDNSRKLFRIRNRNSKGYCTVYQYAHLVSAEHHKLENDIVITKTKPASMLGRAAVGGLFFGGVGAIIGGATAKKKGKTKTKLKKQHIRLFLNDFETPAFDMNIKCTTDGKRIAQELFNLLQYVVNSTTDEEKSYVSRNNLKPYQVKL